MFSRRTMIQGMAAAGALGFGMPSTNMRAATIKKGIKTKRVIFFLQNNGFDPYTCIPKDVTECCSLKEFKLQEHMKDLEPFKDKMHVITGLRGGHADPDHSAFFGALGGYRGGRTTPPAAATIDHVISQNLPKTILPHLCIGMSSLEMAKAAPTVANLSASGTGKPIFMHSDPDKLYEMLFGNIAGGDVNKRYKNRSDILLEVERIASRAGSILPKADRGRFANYTDGLGELNGLREKLDTVSGTLKKYAPKYDDGYTNPEFETDWHDRLLDIGIAALQANLTNVLTIGSGRGTIMGSWKGIGVTEKADHNLGHIVQPGSEIWVKIRQYNCRMLVKLMKSLEAIPEGNGTMMDNTLIVYTSCSAEKQHSRGKEWPFVLLGNGGGQFKTGFYTRVKGRPINDLYATFMRGIGVPMDRFNLDPFMAGKCNSQTGPIENILA